MDLIGDAKVALRLGGGDGVGVGDKDEVLRVHRAELLQLLALLGHQNVLILPSLVQIVLRLPSRSNIVFGIVESVGGGSEEV